MYKNNLPGKIDEQWNNEIALLQYRLNKCIKKENRYIRERLSALFDSIVQREGKMYIDVFKLGQKVHKINSNSNSSI